MSREFAAATCDCLQVVDLLLYALGVSLCEAFVALGRDICFACKGSFGLVVAMLVRTAVHSTLFDRFGLVRFALGLHWIVPLLFGHRARDCDVTWMLFPFPAENESMLCQLWLIGGRILSPKPNARDWRYKRASAENPGFCPRWWVT